MKANYCWLSALKQAISNNHQETHNRYLQLATVRTDGTPAVRTLVFRALRELPERIEMITDSRSEKVTEITTHARAEICWYLSCTREQFRFGGTLVLTGQDSPEQSARDEMWLSLSKSTREQFFTPHPKTLLTTDNESQPQMHKVFQLDTPPDNFLILTMNIEEIDHLILQEESAQRWLSRRDKNVLWTSEAVHP